MWSWENAKSDLYKEGFKDGMLILAIIEIVVGLFVFLVIKAY